ncbi:glycosyltransferase [Candidatus Pelagibacter ubique]|nr:glycosyltransferase [Candidatus Pelagibacter ubique]
MGQDLKKKDFTVLLPIYQRNDLFDNFSEVLDSIYSNTVKPNDLIVLVDGFIKDDFKNKIKREQQKYDFKTLWSEKIGLAKILNKGINEVKTTWIARMDGDDICTLDRFEKSLEFINQGFDLFGGQIMEKEKDSHNIYLKNVPLESKDIKKMLKFRNPFNHMTVFYKTSLAIQVGGYPNIHLKEDYAFWCLLARMNIKIGNMKDIVVKANSDGLYSRRGGLEYLKSEFELQKLLIKFGFTNYLIATLVLLMRCSVYVLPSYLKEIIFKRFLRISYDNR